MKRHTIWSIAIAMFAALSLVSCDKDDDNDSNTDTDSITLSKSAIQNQIFGTWAETGDAEPGPDHDRTIQFLFYPTDSGEGGFAMYVTYIFGIMGGQEQNYTGTYVVNDDGSVQTRASAEIGNDKVVLDDKYRITSLSDEKMTLEKISDNGDIYRTFQLAKRYDVNGTPTDFVKGDYKIDTQYILGSWEEQMPDDIRTGLGVSSLYSFYPSEGNNKEGTFVLHTAKLPIILPSPVLPSPDTPRSNTSTGRYVIDDNNLLQTYLPDENDKEQPYRKFTLKHLTFGQMILEALGDDDKPFHTMYLKLRIAVN